MAATAGLLDVHDALRQAGVLDDATPPSDCVSTARLGGGLTNDNILVTIRQQSNVPGRKLVLRRFKRETSRHLRYNRQHEYDNAKSAALAGVGPEVVAFMPATSQHGGGLLIEFIEGKTLGEEDVRQLSCGRNKDASGPLAIALHRLHSSQAFTNAFDPFAARQIYEEECVLLSQKLEGCEAMWQDFGTVTSKLAELQDRLTALQEEAVSCHNDLLAANFIAPKAKADKLKTPLVIIDYELSGMAPASWELGNIISENGLEDDDEAVHSLVTGYWRLRVDSASTSAPLDCESESWIESRIARARAWSIVSKVTWAAWGRVLHLLTAIEQNQSSVSSSDTAQLAEPAFDYAQWSLSKLERAKAALADADKMDSLLRALQRDTLDIYLQ